jgi:hypothetical protein
MKNYVYYFEFSSGFYESHFYREVTAKDERDAILQVVSYFLNSDESSADQYITGAIGPGWSVSRFWNSIDRWFFNGTEGYSLVWIKEADLELSRIGIAN